MVVIRSSLTVDLSSTHASPTDDDVRHWGTGQSVFVSSLIADLPEERAAARSAIQSVGATPIMFEHDLGAQDLTSERAYLDGLATSTIYLGIYGPRYGVPLPSNYSATEAEFQAADSQNKRMALFVLDPLTGADGRQADFIAGIQNRYTTAPYASPADLEARIASRLALLAAEEITPWVIVGETAFRATSSINGTRLTIRATVRESRIVDYLQRLADKREIIPFASPHRSMLVQIFDISIDTLSATTQRVEITLESRQANSAQSSMAMFGSVNGVSSEVLFIQGLRKALFNEELPAPTASFFGISELKDPLNVLRTSKLPDTALRPLARVLMSEALREQGIPGGVSRFVLGPSRSDGRLLDISWYPPRRYDNEAAPGEQHLSGLIPPLG
jgi:hypothetical protein